VLKSVVIDECDLERMWKVVVVTIFNELSQHYLQGIKKTTKKLIRIADLGTDIKTKYPWLWNRNHASFLWSILWDYIAQC